MISFHQQPYNQHCPAAGAQGAKPEVHRVEKQYLSVDDQLTNTVHQTSLIVSTNQLTHSNSSSYLISPAAAGRQQLLKSVASYQSKVLRSTLERLISVDQNLGLVITLMD